MTGFFTHVKMTGTDDNYDRIAGDYSFIYFTNAINLSHTITAIGGFVESL